MGKFIRIIKKIVIAFLNAIFEMDPFWNWGCQIISSFSMFQDYMAILSRWFWHYFVPTNLWHSDYSRTKYKHLWGVFQQKTASTITLSFLYKHQTQQRTLWAKEKLCMNLWRECCDRRSILGPSCTSALNLVMEVPLLSLIAKSKRLVTSVRSIHPT